MWKNRAWLAIFCEQRISEKKTFDKKEYLRKEYLIRKNI